MGRDDDRERNEGYRGQVAKPRALRSLARRLGTDDFRKTVGDNWYIRFRSAKLDRDVSVRWRGGEPGHGGFILYVGGDRHSHGLTADQVEGIVGRAAQAPVAEAPKARVRYDPDLDPAPGEPDYDQPPGMRF